MKLASKRKIGSKLLLIFTVSLIFLVACFIAENYYAAELIKNQARIVTNDAVYSEVQNRIRFSVESVVSTMEQLYRQRQGTMTEPERIDLILDELRAAVYNKTGYYFVYRYDGVRLVAPENKAQEGTNLWDLTDKDGKKPVQEFVKSAQNGGAFVNYIWKNPATNREEEKLSYVAPLKLGDLNLAVGTGTYLPMLEMAKAAISAKIEGTARESIMRFIISSIIILLLLLAVLAKLISHLISKPIGKLAQATERMALGDCDVQVSVKSRDEIGRLANSFNVMVDNIREGSQAVVRIAEGDLDMDIRVKSDHDILGQSIQQVAATLRDLIHEINNMSQQHDAGDIEIFVPEEKFHGAYRVMATGVNEMVKGHITCILKAITCMNEFGIGNFDAKLEKFPGKKAILHECIEALRKNLKDVNAEISQLVIAANEGNLKVRANPEIFRGDWASLINGLNGLLDAILSPIQEAAAVLNEMAAGNLAVTVQGDYQGDNARIKNALNDTIQTLADYIHEITAVLTQMANGNLNVDLTKDYRGDFVAIKDSLNAIIQSFNEMLGEINNAAAQVAEGSKQIAGSSQTLSQGATEQASTIEELSSSTEEIAAQTKQNAVHANQANDLALAARDLAVSGNGEMQNLLKSMNEINEASGNIAKIIKVIDEIAFQTNILALNAAVEAARAGQHGKGFAVVAEEVRNLAARSADAAKETTALIESTIRKADGGTKIAHETAGALTKIVDGVSKTTALVGEIANASNEQASGITQINQGILQVSGVTQATTATAEESAAASQELTSQAEMLQNMVGRFKLKNGKEDLKKGMIARQNSAPLPAVAQKRSIKLDGSDFGKY